MSHDVLSEPIQRAHVWINEISERLGGADQAYRALRATLHTLRDRLPLETNAHLSAQLPMIIRGMYFEGWDPTAPLAKMHEEEFLARIQQEGLFDDPNAAEEAVTAVMATMWQHLTAGTMDHVGEVLPQDLQRFVY